MRLKGKLEWADYMWRKPKILIKTVLQENPRGKRLLGRSRIRVEDCVKKYVGEFYPYEDWHMLAQNCNGWRRLCLDVCRKKKNSENSNWEPIVFLN